MVTCNYCNQVYQSNVNFCSNCGKKIEINHKKRVSLDVIIAFYVSILVYIGLSYYILDAYPDNFSAEIITESLFAFLVLGFSASNFKDLVKLYKLPKINIWMIVFVLLTFANAFVVNYFVSLVNGVVDPESLSESYYEYYIFLDHPLIWSIFFIAILPPIFEELAFRGFLFNALNKLTSVKTTIIATSFLFALIHLSVVSILWIFPFGIFLGYLRWKYNSLWIPMLIHFIHNFTVLMIDYYSYTPI